MNDRFHGVVDRADSTAARTRQAQFAALAGAGSGTVSTVDNTVESVIQGSKVYAGGSVNVTANDDSLINTAAGAGSLSLSFGNQSKAAAVGVAVSVNDIENNVRADVVD